MSSVHLVTFCTGFLSISNRLIVFISFAAKDCFDKLIVHFVTFSSNLMTSLLIFLIWQYPAGFT